MAFWCGNVHAYMSPMTREDQVRQLCALAAATKTEAELTAILLQLQSVIREQIQNLSAIAAEEIPRAFGNDSTTAN